MLPKEWTESGAAEPDRTGGEREQERGEGEKRGRERQNKTHEDETVGK